MSEQLKILLRDLKARAYDKLSQIESLEIQVMQINQEIAQVSNEISSRRGQKHNEPKSEEAVGESKQLLTEKK